MKNLKFMEHLLNNHHHHHHHQQQQHPEEFRTHSIFPRQLSISRCRIKTTKSRRSNNRAVFFSSLSAFLKTPSCLRGYKKKMLKCNEEKKIFELFFFKKFFSPYPSLILFHYFLKYFLLKLEILGRIIEPSDLISLLPTIFL